MLRNIISTEVNQTNKEMRFHGFFFISSSSKQSPACLPDMLTD